VPCSLRRARQNVDARRGAGVLEERQVHARRAVLVAVEEVIDGRFVLVDGALDHAHAEHARVELDVASCVAGDGADVVDALEPHVAANRLAEAHMRSSAPCKTGR
jgi:hypothetical protein